MNRYRSVLTVFAVFMLISVSLAAQCKMSAPKGGHDCKATCMQGLNEEQMEKMEKLHLHHQQEIVDIDAGIKKANLKIREEFMSDAPDMKTLEGLVEKLTALKGKKQKSKIGMMLEAKKIMPAEHWKIFVKNHFDGSCSHAKCGSKGMRGGSGCGKGMKGMKAGCMSMDRKSCGGAQSRGCASGTR